MSQSIAAVARDEYDLVITDDLCIARCISPDVRQCFVWMCARVIERKFSQIASNRGIEFVVWLEEHYSKVPSGSDLGDF